MKPIGNPLFGKWPFPTAFDHAWAFWLEKAFVNRDLRLALNRPMVKPKVTKAGVDYGPPPTITVMFGGLESENMSFTAETGELCGYSIFFDMKTVMDGYKPVDLKAKKLHVVPGTAHPSISQDNCSLWRGSYRGSPLYQVRGGESYRVETAWLPTAEDAIKHAKLQARADQESWEAYKKFRIKVEETRRRGPQAMAKLKATKLFKRFANQF